MKTITTALAALVLSVGFAHADGAAYDRQHGLGIFDKRGVSPQTSVELNEMTGFTRQHNPAQSEDNSPSAVDNQPRKITRDASGGWPNFQ